MMLRDHATTTAVTVRRPGRTPLLALLALGVCTCAAAALLAPGCLETAQERAELDDDVGSVEVSGTRFTIGERHGTFQQAEPGSLVVWAQAPSLLVSIDATGAAMPASWNVRIRNVMQGARMTAFDVDTGMPVAVNLVDRAVPTAGAWQVDVLPGQRIDLVLQTDDANDVEPYRYVVLSDVQRAVDHVGEIFSVINADPEVRFVVSTGDLTNTGTAGELERFQTELGALRVPFFSTVGNHELGVEPDKWADRFGPFNFSWVFKGARFTLVDSGNATIDPSVYDRLDVWLERGRGQVHTFLTHIPPIDPVGTRNGSFRSRREAGKLLSKLGEGAVDLTVYGHVHSYYAFENAGIPAYISGGGGALPERLDGIERHYLTVDIDPMLGTQKVSIVRID